MTKLLPPKAMPILLTCALISGCATTHDLESRANQHDKNAAYYSQIGQPVAAGEERASAQEDRNDAQNPLAILTTLFNIFTQSNSDDKNDD